MTARRIFLQTLAAAALPAAMERTWAQAKPRVFRVGLLSIVGRDTPYHVAFLQRMRELGYVEGRNFILDMRPFQSRDELPALAAALARSGCDVMLGAGSEAQLLAFRAAAVTQPVVMVAIDYDPVARGHIKSLPRPGGVITGVTFQNVEIVGKRLEQLKETLPKADRIAVLFDDSTRDQLSAAEAAAKTLGLTLLPAALSGASYDFDAAAATARAKRAKAILLLSSGAFFAGRFKLIAAASRERLPVFSNRNYDEAGALLAFGPSFPEMYRRAAEFVDRILKGAKPADLPVEQPTRFELIVNLKTAKTLGIKIPESVMLRADRVIE